jgi:uncharacterized protein
MIQRETGQSKSTKADVAQAAALVHDVGHGMFSHAFEEIGKKLGINTAHHEVVSRKIILESEISTVLCNQLNKGFAEEVADVIGRKSPASVYDAVVSSQFDADRLDYMQRDRMMTGVQSSGVDATWLLENLEIADVPSGADEDQSKDIQTLVLGPKAFYAAENYVLSLFQLYPNVYFHKATRAAEKVFTDLITRVILLTRDGHLTETGLFDRHPLIKFARDPENLANVLALDDAVFWASLPMMAEADDRIIRSRARQLRDRSLPKCIDIRQRVESELPVSPGMTDEDRKEREALISLRCKSILAHLANATSATSSGQPGILIDQTERPLYKRFQDSRMPLNQISIKLSGGRVEDMANLSPVVASAAKFEVCRAYVTGGDSADRVMVENVMRTVLRSEAGNGSV